MSNFCEHEELPSGPMGQWPHATGFFMPCIKTCYTVGSQHDSSSDCISRLGSESSRRMASGHKRSPLNWLRTLSGGGIIVGRCDIYSKRARMPHGALPVRKPWRTITGR